jgi:TonB family protein
VAADLPAQATVATGIGVEQPAVPLAGNVLRARQLEDACRLPDYPDDVVRADQPLRVTLAYRVDAEGRVRDAAVTAPSGQPAWDAALVAAMGNCAYLPALRDGSPIALPMTWTITRERGTRRPRESSPAP